MPTLQPRVNIPAALLCALSGALGGLAVFGGSATLWRSGLHHTAALAAQSALVLTLTVTAVVVLLAQPTRQRRARVPVGRAVPLAWWPASDPLPVLAAWMGVPAAAGAGVAALVFR